MFWMEKESRKCLEPCMTLGRAILTSNLYGSKSFWNLGLALPKETLYNPPLRLQAQRHCFEHVLIILQLLTFMEGANNSAVDCYVIAQLFFLRYYFAGKLRYTLWFIEMPENHDIVFCSYCLSMVSNQHKKTLVGATLNINYSVIIL